MDIKKAKEQAKKYIDISLYLKFASAKLFSARKDYLNLLRLFEDCDPECKESCMKDLQNKNKEIAELKNEIRQLTEAMSIHAEEPDVIDLSKKQSKSVEIKSLGAMPKGIVGKTELLYFQSNLKGKTKEIIDQMFKIYEGVGKDDEMLISAFTVFRQLHPFIKHLSAKEQFDIIYESTSIAYKANTAAYIDMSETDKKIKGFSSEQLQKLIDERESN